MFEKLITDSVSMGGNAITSLSLSVHLFPFYLLNRLIFGLDLFACVRVTIVARGGLKLKVTGQD